MSNPVNPLEPRLIDTLLELKRQILLEFNCAHLTTIQEFNSAKKTCKATVNYKKTFFVRNPSGEYVPELIEYPALVDVPVWGPRGGGAQLDMPIAEGDQALILFNDRDINNWVAGKLNGDLASNRLHSFSDGIAFVGLQMPGDIDADFDATRASLRFGHTRVGVNADKVLIENATFTLNTLLASLIDTINAITTTNCVVGLPVVLSPTSITALNSVKADIAALLE